MPTYEMKPDDLLSADVQSIPQSDDSSAYMETPSLLSAINPFTDNQQVQRGRDAAFRIDNSLEVSLPLRHSASLTRLMGITLSTMMQLILKDMRITQTHSLIPALLMRRAL